MASAWGSRRHQHRPSRLAFGAGCSICLGCSPGRLDTGKDQTGARHIKGLSYYGVALDMTPELEEVCPEEKRCRPSDVLTTCSLCKETW
jgi:hypothetical protein